MTDEQLIKILKGLYEIATRTKITREEIDFAEKIKKIIEENEIENSLYEGNFIVRFNGKNENMNGKKLASVLETQMRADKEKIIKIITEVKTKSYVLINSIYGSFELYKK